MAKSDVSMVSDVPRTTVVMFAAVIVIAPPMDTIDGRLRVVRAATFARVRKVPMDVRAGMLMDRSAGIVDDPMERDVPILTREGREMSVRTVSPLKANKSEQHRRDGSKMVVTYGPAKVAP